MTKSNWKPTHIFNATAESPIISNASLQAYGETPIRRGDGTLLRFLEERGGGFGIYEDKSGTKFMLGERILQKVGAEEPDLMVLDAVKNQNICDECTDADGVPTGWKENRVEGRYVCACIAESEPYLALRAENARLREALERRGLTFAQLRVANRTRNEALFPADDWSLNDWMTAAAGELGEAANVLKKIRRGDYSLNGDSYGTPSARDMLANELGDVVAYLDLLADHAGIDLGSATAQKWDAISVRRGYPKRIGDFAQPEPSAPCETCGGSGLVAIGEPELLDPEVPWSLQQPCEPCPACGGGA